MARYEFKLPDIGEGIAEAEIVAWHVKVGDMVAEDQQIADMMTDKATVEMESPVAGKVVQVAGNVGDQIPIGSVLVVFETEGEVEAEEAPLADGMSDVAEEMIPTEDVQPVERRSSEDRRAAEEDRRTEDRGGEDRRVGEWRAREAPAEAGAPPAAERAQAAAAQAPKILASPAVRQRARDLGIDLAQVKYSGDRIRHADLDAFLLYQGGAVARGPAPRRMDEDVKVVGLRRRIAENLQEAKRRIPHFTYVDEVDVTALEQTRAMMNMDKGDNPKLTMLPFLISGMCRVLVDYPQINATFDDDAGVIHRSGAVHMGMATQTEHGLAVPVIRNAEGRDVWNLAREILRLAEATRTGKATRDELSGSTITISSLGPMGGIVSTPVINRPEVAIIAVNKVKEMPVVVDGELEIRKMMNLSLSCDHRVVDGWDAASFIQDLKKLLENPLRLLSMR
ncbi:dihydrolipoamide acetyltransferase family protein [Sphingosinicella sp. CPCC 101087]|uniref:dihydrolipoamide acetyltransferase family protein n=1 Tax=Sphingosinicella sp. CPCC 101087 TaxID=2497754 RepID=UPI00101E1C2C|nr:dihydrolipoamide acetyltransferase family protein [Sphingosinicella sp. CPCC 101087]